MARRCRRYCTKLRVSIACSYTGIGEAVAYLHQRGLRSPELIEHMRIGYAPGGCLRGWLTQLGYPLQALRQAGLVTAAGYDAYITSHRVSAGRQSLWPQHV